MLDSPRPPRPRRGARRATLLPTAFVAAALSLLSACSSGGGSPTDPGPLAPLVGSWTATSMVLTSKNDSTVSADLIQGYGASFILDVQADGRYSATLSYAGQTAQAEQGTITATGSSLTLDPDGSDPPRDGTWSLEGGTLVIDSETSFDFNFDGTPESAFLHLELQRG